MRMVTMEIEARSWIQNTLSVGGSTWLEKGRWEIIFEPKILVN